MFESFYGLKSNPFRMSADEHFRYSHQGYVKAWSYLKYALEQAEGFVVITGRPGTGKTTLIRDTLSELDSDRILPVNLVTNQLQGEELLRLVALEFGFPAQDFNKATLLTRIEQHAHMLHDQGRRVVVIVDEAQNLTPHGLEELRLLSNLQRGNRSLFQIVLVGQEELRSLIYGQGIENVQQRIVASCRLEPLQVEHLQGYVEHRLDIAGWDGDPSIEMAIYPLLYRITHGVPREINLVMARLLLYGSLEQKHSFTQQDLLVVLAELDQEQRLAFDQTVTLSEFQAAADEGQTGAEEVTASSNENRLEADGGSLEETETQAKEVEQTAEQQETSAKVTRESDTQEPEFADAAMPPVFADDWSDMDILEETDPLFMESSEPDETTTSETTAKATIDELPSLHVDQGEDRRNPQGLFTDVSDLLENGNRYSEVFRSRWRWFFYPLAIVLLLVALLVPKPHDLTVLWHYLRKGVETTISQQQQKYEPQRKKEPPQIESTHSTNENTPAETAFAGAETEAPMRPLKRPDQAEDDTPEKDRLIAAPNTPQETEPVDKPANLLPETDRRNWLIIDQASGEPAEESRAFYAQLLARLNANPSTMVVLTGVSGNGEGPWKAMRNALGQAEQAATLFEHDGIARRRIVIEGKSNGARPGHSGVRVWITSGQ